MTFGSEGLNESLNRWWCPSLWLKSERYARDGWAASVIHYVVMNIFDGVLRLLHFAFGITKNTNTNERTWRNFLIQEGMFDGILDLHIRESIRQLSLRIKSCQQLIIVIAFKITYSVSHNHLNIGSLLCFIPERSFPYHHLISDYEMKSVLVAKTLFGFWRKIDRSC